MLLIDCYNLLHTPMPQPLAGLDEARLVALLAADRGKAACIVCDGVEKPHAPASLSVEGVELVYAGAGRSADDVIIEMIDADSAPRQLVVVSNDRQIQRAATRRRAKAMTCERFIGTLAKRASRHDRPTRQSTSAKPTPSGDTNYWLQQFGFTPNQKPAQPNACGLASPPTILWQRLPAAPSGTGLDTAQLISAPTGHDLRGVALFVHNHQPVRLDYHIHCDTDWHTQHAAVRGYIGPQPIDLAITRLKHRWSLNNTPLPQLDHCSDLDLAFTPATNLIALRRLSLSSTTPRGTSLAAWLQWPSLELTPLEQRYRRVGEAYRYDVPSLNYTATLRVNAAGFVTHYADQWEAIAFCREERQ